MNATFIANFIVIQINPEPGLISIISICYRLFGLAGL
jgi:hypothetical protein